MSAQIPEGFAPYKRTRTFTETTVPGALLAEHSTKDGVWGLIRVEEGRLRYCVTDPRRPATERVLTPEEPSTVEPMIVLRVEAMGPVRLHVAILRAQPSG